MKHDVAFENAQDFAWETATVIPDRRRNYGEARYLAYGLIERRLHVLVFTPRGDKIRIIGLRKANERERAIYETSKTPETHF